MEMHGGPEKRIRRVKPEPYRTKEDHEKKRVEAFNTVSLSDAGLPAKQANVLEKHGVLTVGDLTKLSRADMDQIPNLGELTRLKCSQLLDMHNLPNNLK